MPTTEKRRRELAEFLRSRRARLTPEQVGLPTTGRRRTPGLRREELALLAGMSATWYTYLEQARDIRVSDQVLDALSIALRLERPERAHLQQLAGRAATPDDGEPERLAPGVARMPQLLEPSPAYVTGANYDLLSWNDAAAELFPGVVDLPRDRRNLVWWIFTDAGAREVFPDWEREARRLLARLRAAAGRHPGDVRFARLVEDLHAHSPEVREWWPRYDVRTEQGGSKRLRHPRLGEMTVEHTVFTVAESPGQQLVVYALPPPSSTYS